LGLKRGIIPNSGLTGMGGYWGFLDYKRKEKLKGFPISQDFKRTLWGGILVSGLEVY